MHILITRPEPSALQLASRLNDSGLQTIVMPLYRFEAFEPDSRAIGQLEKSSGRKLVIFTSPRAVQFGLEYLTAAAGNSIEIAALGNATRKQLEAAGCSVDIQAQSGYTSEDLLAMPQLSQNPACAFIFCAPDGRQQLANGLTKLGWQVNKLHVYKRLESKPAQAQVEEVRSANSLLTLWTSQSAIDLAHNSLPVEVWSKILSAPALVISARLKHHLQQLGASQIELSDGPGNTALLFSIKRMLA